MVADFMAPEGLKMVAAAAAPTWWRGCWAAEVTTDLN